MRHGIALLLTLLVAPSSSGADAFFSSTGALPGHVDSLAIGVSGDGEVVVGQSLPSGGSQAFAWTRADGIVELEKTIAIRLQAAATRASWDGSVIVGFSSPSQFRFEAARWVHGEIDFLDVSTSVFVSATDVSADGAVIAIGGFVPTEGLLWREPGEVTPLDMVPFGLSQDGTTAVGAIFEPGQSVASRWTEEKGVEVLGQLPGVRRPRDEARAVSADGSIVLGTALDAQGAMKPFRWTESAGMITLEDLAGPTFDGEVADASDDGAIVVGYALAPFETAAIWDPLHGMQLLKPYLEAEFGLDLSGWQLFGANGISADGRTIVGWGLGPETDRDESDGWVIILPHRSGDIVHLDVRPGDPENRLNPLGNGIISVAILGAEYFHADEVDVESLAFGPAGGESQLRTKLRDVDGDGHEDLVLKLRIGALGLTPGDTELCVEGTTLPGMPFAGCDTVRTNLACALGWELVVLLPLLLARLRARLAAAERPVR